MAASAGGANNRPHSITLHRAEPPQVDLPVNSRGTLGTSTNQNVLTHVADLAADENSIPNLDVLVALDDKLTLG